MPAPSQTRRSSPERQQDPGTRDGPDPNDDQEPLDGRLPGKHTSFEHRPEGDTRRVPIHPELVTMYVEDDPDSRVFVGKHRGPITDRICLKVFHETRKRAERDTPIAPSACRGTYREQAPVFSHT